MQYTVKIIKVNSALIAWSELFFLLLFPKSNFFNSNTAIWHEQIKCYSNVRTVRGQLQRSFWPNSLHIIGIIVFLCICLVWHTVQWRVNSLYWKRFSKYLFFIFISFFKCVGRYNWLSYHKLYFKGSFSHY